MLTRVREDYRPASADVVMKPDFPVGAVGDKVGNCVSDCQAWHFRSKSFVFLASLVLLPVVRVGERLDSYIYI
jgi:hypothetical protein